MNLKNLLKLINEEVQNWFNDEPSIADKYYQNNYGLNNQNNSNVDNNNISGELIGYLDKAWSSKLHKPIPVYKNPKNLRGFENYVKGILVENGDIYISLTNEGLHFNIIELLGKKNIIPNSSVVHNYGQQMPEQYITIIRKGNGFTQSTAYDEFPYYYEAMFDLANQTQPYRFTITPFDNY